MSREVATTLKKEKAMAGASPKKKKRDKLKRGGKRC